ITSIGSGPRFRWPVNAPRGRGHPQGRRNEETEGRDEAGVDSRLGLHSRVRCKRPKSDGTSGQEEGNSLRINSKDALAIARIALEHAGDADEMLAAIQQEAEMLAEERRLKRAKPG